MGNLILMEHLVAAFCVETQVLPVVGEQHHSLASALANVILQIRQELSAYALTVKCGSTSIILRYHTSGLFF